MIVYIYIILIIWFKRSQSTTARQQALKYQNRLTKCSMTFECGSDIYIYCDVLWLWVRFGYKKKYMNADTNLISTQFGKVIWILAMNSKPHSGTASAPLSTSDNVGDRPIFQGLHGHLALHFIGYAATMFSSIMERLKMNMSVSFFVLR